MRLNATQSDRSKFFHMLTTTFFESLWHKADLDTNFCHLLTDLVSCKVVHVVWFRLSPMVEVLRHLSVTTAGDDIDTDVWKCKNTKHWLSFGPLKDSALPWNQRAVLQKQLAFPQTKGRKLKNCLTNACISLLLNFWWKIQWTSVTVSMIPLSHWEGWLWMEQRSSVCIKNSNACQFSHLIACNSLLSWDDVKQNLWTLPFLEAQVISPTEAWWFLGYS